MWFTQPASPMQDAGLAGWLVGWLGIARSLAAGWTVY